MYMKGKILSTMVFKSTSYKTLLSTPPAGRCADTSSRYNNEFMALSKGLACPYCARKMLEGYLLE